jgi:hypothetical protein
MGVRIATAGGGGIGAGGEAVVATVHGTSFAADGEGAADDAAMLEANGGVAVAIVGLAWELLRATAAPMTQASVAASPMRRPVRDPRNGISGRVSV